MTGWLIFSVDFLNNPEAVDMPADKAGMGVLSAVQIGGAARCTFLVDREYALMILQDRHVLGGDLVLGAEAMRWLRLGWPEEWPHPELPNEWAPIHPDGAEAVQ
ncbi:hypothetical protein AHiyo4_38170 [Arthrobacter sp. Hiyo4]|nr:hypothetical protein AHiyo4_38170 [Arthrobacter sp. Hiyo4]